MMLRTQLNALGGSGVRSLRSVTSQRLSMSRSSASGAVLSSGLCSKGSKREYSTVATAVENNNLKFFASLSKSVGGVKSCFGFAPVPRRSFSEAVARSPAVENIRNVAIIAHVDHGKTTLVDTLLKLAGELNEATERVMDSNQLEQERGITIISKVTSINWQGSRLNIVDTPGHGDFGGEVERVMSMVNGVVLVVDATEGVMTQTKYVLSKALKNNLKPVVVINKMDRPSARVDEVESEVFDLFVSLEATDEQLDYPTIYASGRDGWASTTKEKRGENMAPILEAVLKHVPKPRTDEAASFSMVASILEYDNFLGRVLTGRIYNGQVSPGMKIKGLDSTGKMVDEGTVTKVVVKAGLEKKSLDVGGAGDIVSITGLSKANVTHTLCALDVITAHKTHPLDPPVLKMTFGVNDSPLGGKEGNRLTSGMIRDRLMKELEVNPALQVDFSQSNSFEVSGRGELHLGILIENMRREGFELTVGPPRVIYLTDEHGKRLEPIEELTIDLENQYLGFLMEVMNLRKASLIDMRQGNEKTRLQFLCPSRSLIGLRSLINQETRGSTVINTLFSEYAPFKGAVESVQKGALIASQTGKSTGYALNMTEERGILFVTPGMQVYEGMIVGEHSRDNDLEVNVAKEKHLTNMRAAGKEEGIRLSPPRLVTLESAIATVKMDELIEVTPTKIRLRKFELNGAKRKAKNPKFFQ